MDRDLLERFLEEASKVGAELYPCLVPEDHTGNSPDNPSIPKAIISRLQRVAGNGIIRASSLPKDILNDLDGLAIATSGNAAETTLCLSYAVAGIASTGSVLIYLRDPEERALTALATKHVVFLRRKTIVATLRDLTPTLKDQLSGQTPNYLSITTGPSRTADIERVLTIGVHGPKELHIFILEGE